MKNTRPHRPTLFRVELCGVKVVTMECRTERENVVGGGYRPLTPGHIETVDEIDKLAVLEWLEIDEPRLEQRLCLLF